MIPMSTAEIQQLLDDSLIGRLCLADAVGQPYSLPFPFCWHNGSLYLRLAMSGRKGEILRHNNRVCFEVDWCAAEMRDYASIIIEGRLVPVTDSEEKTAARAANETKYRRLRPRHRPGHGHHKPLEKLAMHKIAVACISGRRMEPTPAEVPPHLDDENDAWIAAAPL